MIFLCPGKKPEFDLTRGLFVSTHMATQLSGVRFTERLYPVHLPYKGLIRLNYGDDDRNEASACAWNAAGLPPLYTGEDLSRKKLAVFPMHALGDQLYLAVALRALAQRYEGLEITVVRSGIPSVEKWYPYIYSEPHVRLAESVLSAREMRAFDAFVDAEHFAHLPGFRGSYTADFFMEAFFHHSPKIMAVKVPRVTAFSPGNERNSETIDRTFEKLRSLKEIVVFVNLVSTGRSRDLSMATVMDFAGLISGRCAVIFSTYNNPGFEDIIRSMNMETFVCSGDLETHVTDLMGIIRRSDYVITTDSGITHLSEALEKPCGTVFNTALPEERTACYRFSETLRVEFEIPGICRTPCYVFALENGELCPGMKFANSCLNHEGDGLSSYNAYPPCMEHVRGEHLRQLLDALEGLFPATAKNP